MYCICSVSASGDLFTIREEAWYIISDNNLRKPWRIFTHPVYLERIQVKFVYEGHRVKVTGATKVENRYSRNVKLWSAITLSSVEHTAMKFVCSKGFRIWQIEWCDGDLLIGSNSSSVKHTAIKLYAAMADRMVWRPSLSRDRNWPRETKCTHSRVGRP